METPSSTLARIPDKGNQSPSLESSPLSPFQTVQARANASEDGLNQNQEHSANASETTDIKSSENDLHQTHRPSQAMITASMTSRTQSYSTANSWLLRLFHSEFFDSRLALCYLHRYPETVGIQHYICEELKKFPAEEIEFLLPQLCHLSATRHSKSVALENFILHQCTNFPHIAILTLWYFQAYVSDLIVDTTTPNYKHIKALHRKVQSLVLHSEKSPTSPLSPPSHVPSVAQTLPVSSLKRIPIKENVRPALVGMAAMMAAIACPALLQVSKSMVIAEGRRNRSWHFDEPVSSTVDQSNSGNVNQKIAPSLETTEQSNDSLHTSTLRSGESTSAESGPTVAVSHDLQNTETPSKPLVNKIVKVLPRLPVSSPSLEDLHRGSAFSYTSKLSSSSASSLPPKSTSDQTTSSSSKSPNISTNSLSDVPTTSPTRELVSNGTEISVETALPSKTQTAENRPFASSHYFHNELQFVMALVEISERLMTVPKEARMSTLVAELTLINHNLPAEVCIPMWCPATLDCHRHHKVVRISPTDAVILNSADRVPYLILVEVVDEEHNGDVTNYLDNLAKLKLESNSIASSEGSRDSWENTHPASPIRSVKQLEDESISPTLAPPPPAAIRRSSKTSTKLATTAALNDSSTNTSSNDVTSPVASVTSATSPTSLVESGHQSSRTNLSSYEYYRTVLDRRQHAQTSIMVHSQSNGNFEGTSSLNQKPPSSPLPLPSSLSVSVPSNPRKAAIIAETTLDEMSPTTEEFAAKMRTAAVMLAQLHRQEAMTAKNSTASAKLDPTAGSNNASFNNGLPAEGSNNPPTNSSVKPTTSASSQAKGKVMLEDIRNRIIREMMALEEHRRQALEKRKGSFVLKDGIDGRSMEDPLAADDVLQEGEEIKLREVCAQKSKDDPSAAVFREAWEAKKARIRASSPYGSHPNWRLLSVIVKTGADLRQEQLACQLIREMQRIWKDLQVPVWVYYYRVLVASQSTGFIETIRNSISIHSIKKDAYARQINQKGLAFTLYDYFVKEFGQPGCDSFQKAQDHFMRSLAAYSLISYLLQLKDRHNGNILLDNQGHIIHIDFGFMLSNSPGSVGFELAPFKMPQEYLDILGGLESEKFAEFKRLMKEGFLAVRKHCDQIVGLVEMMEKDSPLPCFTGTNAKPNASSTASSLTLALYGYLPGSNSGGNGLDTRGSAGTHSTATNKEFGGSSSAGTGSNKVEMSASAALRDRFQLHLSDAQISEFVDRLVESSCGNIFTRLYDTFQYYSNGIL